MASLAIAARTLPAGPVIIGPLAVPLRATAVKLNLDVTNVVAGEKVTLSIELTTDRGGTWRILAQGDVRGPWVDRQSVTHNDAEIGTNFRKADVNSYVRGIIDCQSALAISGGSLIADQSS